jgi:hypothetical protein
MKQSESRKENLVASTWRALPSPYCPPDLAELKWRASLHGYVLRSVVFHEDDGGYRHTLTMVPKEGL